MQWETVEISPWRLQSLGARFRVSDLSKRKLEEIILFYYLSIAYLSSVYASYKET